MNTEIFAELCALISVVIIYGGAFAFWLYTEYEANKKIYKELGE